MFALLRRSMSTGNEAYLHDSASGQHTLKKLVAMASRLRHCVQLDRFENSSPGMSDEIGKTQRFAGRSERRFLDKNGNKKS